VTQQNPNSSNAAKYIRKKKSERSTLSRLPIHDSPLTPHASFAHLVYFYSHEENATE